MHSTTAWRDTVAGVLIGLVALLALLGSDGGSPTAATVDLVPNLKALPPRDVQVEQDGAVTNLRFSTTSWNGGAGVLELRPGAIDNQEDTQLVYQRIYASGGGFRHALAGSFVWHQGHNHFHFDDYAMYTLRRVGNQGDSGIAVKTTFCVMDTDRIDGSLPGAPVNAVYNSCGSTFQGMSVGWGDTYGHYLPGQEIDVTGLPAADYTLTLDVDPEGRIEESDETDNSSTILVRLDPAAETAVVLPDDDGDGVTNAEDNCSAWSNTAQQVPTWTIPAGDDDCDGFAASREQHVGTDPIEHCNATTGVNDEPDAWPGDFNDDKITNLADVSSFNSTYNKLQNDNGYSQRHDLNASNSVTLADVSLIAPFYNRTCG